MFLRSTGWLAASAAVFAAGAAFAQVQEARAVTDLNLRSGPGSNYSVTGVIPANAPVMVEGCVEAARWCRVNLSGARGWAAGDYLAMTVEDAVIPFTSGDVRVVYPTIAYAGDSTAVLTGRPAGALVRVTEGGSYAAPDPNIVTYVQQHPVAPIWLDGEVVPGAALPPTVVLTPIPESRYVYSYVNGVPVIVEPQRREIIRIVR